MAAVQQRGQMPMQPPQAGAPQGQPGQPQGPPQNPAQKIPFPLIPHIHLKSAQIYPQQRQLSFEHLFQYLHDARRIVNHVKPVEWTYLDPPQDGTVMLVWQAPGQIQFASDGYIWCDGEQQMTRRHQNYNVEIFQHRSGYSPGETVAAHSRRRYRLTPAAPANIAPCDPSLWIVHYGRAEPRDQIPVDRVPPNPQTAQIMQQRALIEASGRIVRKQFMLTDASNWPALKVPEQMMRQRGASMADTEHAAKRQRQDEDSVEIIEVNPQIDDDEDKDAFDTLTPRDISIHRYTRHSEWMEELFASPYALSNIKPVSLGLGRGGALRKLTKDYYTGALDERNARQPDRFRGGADIAKPITSEDGDKFAGKVEAEIAKIRKEMEAMTKAQEQTISSLQDKTIFGDAEASLEYAVLQPNVEDPWNLEAGSHFKPSSSQRRPRALVDDIVREVSAKLGQGTKTQPQFRCVSKGGYQTPPPPPSPPALDEEEEEDLGDTEAGGLDTEMGEDNYGGDSQFVDFNDADDAPQGLSDKPHPDTQANATAVAAAAAGSGGEGRPGEDEWVVLDKPASQAESATNGAPLQEGAAAAGASGAAKDEAGDDDDDENRSGGDADDMVDFGADSGTNNDNTPGDFDGADFNASIDFGDLPEDDAAAGAGANDNDDDDGDEDDGMDSAFADAMAPTDDVPDSGPKPAAGEAEGQAQEAGAASAQAASAAAAPAGATTADDIAMDLDGARGEQGGNGAAAADGNDDEPPVDFEDSAFGDAFHHTEFETGDGGPDEL